MEDHQQIVVFLKFNKDCITLVSLKDKDANVKTYNTTPYLNRLTSFKMKF
jgi:hypothetical protein